MKQIFNDLKEQLDECWCEPQYYHTGEDFYNGIARAQTLVSDAAVEWEEKLNGFVKRFEDIVKNNSYYDYGRAFVPADLIKELMYDICGEICTWKPDVIIKGVQCYKGDCGIRIEGTTKRCPDCHKTVKVMEVK